MYEVTEVTVGASRKKQFNRYEPAESSVSLTAQIKPGAEEKEVEEIVQELQEEAGELAKRDILRKYESYVTKDMEAEE